MNKKMFTTVLAVLSLFSAAFAATYSGGSGTAIDPYIVSSATDIQTLSQTSADWSSAFSVSADIDVSALALDPIGTFAVPFSGSFEGGSNTITYSYSDELSSDWTAGLFGYVTGSVSNLSVDAAMTPQEMIIPIESGWIGGIVAVNGGTVSSCTLLSSSSITVESSGGSGSNVAVGGIVGGNDGTIEDCQMFGSISGDVFNVYAGGIAGSNGGIIDGCGFYGSASIDIGNVDVMSLPYNFFTAAGGIAGYSFGEAQILDCSTSSTTEVVNAAYDGYVGGIAGINSALIDGASTEASVTFTDVSGQVGGLCGYNYMGYIYQSEAVCDVSASSNFFHETGGFVGVNMQADIEESYFFGTVQSSSNSSTAGMFVGANSSSSDIINCYAIGQASMPSILRAMIVGGFAGVNDASASITNSYVVDKESKTNYSLDDESNGGGLIGYKESGAVTAAFWNYETVGIDPSFSVGYGDDTGAMPQTTSVMKTQSTFTTQSWDFSTVWTMSGAGSEFEGYPILSWQVTTPGVDTLDINLVVGWNWISFNVLPQDTTLSNVLADYASIAADGDQILAENGQNATYFGGQWFGTLETSGTIEPGEMYKLKSANGGMITVEGSYVDPATSIQLVQGWNWLGYTLSGPSNFVDAIATLNAADNDYITNQLGQNSTYYQGTWYGNLATLTPGLGYMLKVDTPQAFIYNNVVATNISAPKMVEPSSAPDWESPLGLQNTMTVYAQIETPSGDPVAELSGSMLSAWNGDDIAGVVDVSAGPFGAYYQLSVFSDQTSVPGMTLKVYDADTDTIYPINETFDFVSGNDIGEFTSPEIFTIGQPTVYYTVTFDAGTNGSITDGDATQQVEEGTDAVAPTVEANTGWIFAGWDVAYTNVTSDITVTAQYDPQTFTVTFVAGNNGSITAGEAVQTVNYGDDAVAPTVTPTAGYDFVGWDAEFTDVTADITVNALYDVPEFTVTFDAGTNGSITAGDAVQTVGYGNAAAEPTVTANTGWVFTGWDVAFDNITDDLTVTAQYQVQTFTVTFDAGVKGSIASGTAVQTIAYGQGAVAPSITPYAGWVFSGWDVVFNNITDDLTVTALYDAQICTVTFEEGDFGCIYTGQTEQDVVYGGSADSPVVMPEYGYKFSGWSDDITGVTGDLTVTAQYTELGELNCFDADLNDDMLVDDIDLVMLASDWLDNGTLDGDADGNLWANVWDYSLLSDCWLASLGGELDINLVVGTNWISFNVLPEGAGIEDVMADFASIATDGDKLFAEDGLNATYFGGQWYGTLKDSGSIEAGLMYKLKTAQAGTFTVQGVPVDPETTIDLISGWNWLGYTPAQAMPLNTLMSGLNATDGDYIVAQNGKNATYWGGQWYGQLAQLEPGMGYMLKVANAQTFTYNTMAVSSADFNIAISIEAVPATWVSPVGLQNTMKINAQVMQGMNYVGTAAGSKLSAWDPDGNIAGVADVVVGPAGSEFILSVFSNETNVSDMTLRLYDADADMVYNVIETFDFVDGAEIGLIVTPEIYHIPDDWENPVGLEYTMVLYAQVEMDDVQIATAAGSLMSVWDPEGNIAGVAEVTAGPSGPLFVLSIFSDLAEVDNLKLKLYDSETGLYYDINGTIDFVANTTLGTLIDPIIFTVGGLDWFEEDTGEPATTWIIDGENFESGAVDAMTGSGISSAPIDVSGYSTVSFDVQTDCGNQCFLIFGITDAAGTYHIVDYWSGLTPVTPVTVDLAPYKVAGDNIIFRWTYSKGRYTAGADKVWVWNFALNN